MLKWSLSAEFLALILIVTLMFYFHEKGLADTARRRMFRLCLWLSAGSILLNMVCVFTIERAARLPLWVNLVLNSAYFLVVVLTCSVMALYLFSLILEHVYDKHCLTQAFACVSALTGTYFLAVVWNFWSGVLFSFDAAGRYLRGPLNGLGYGVMAAELVLLGVCYFRNRPSVNRSMKSIMHALPPIAILLTAFQFFYPGLLLNGTLVAMADLLLFVSFQSRRIELDSLTCIGNRNRFFSEIALRTAGRQHFQVVLLGLTQFSAINQRFGHQNGDAFLCEIAHCLDGLHREGSAFRFGNVEFAVLLPSGSEAENRARLDRIRARFDQPWRLGNVEAYVSARCAELVYAGEDWAPTQIIEYLDYSLHLAKTGQEPVVRFDPSVAQRLERRKDILELMRRSIREKRFRVWYQPVYSCHEKAFTAAEALLRLRDDCGRPVPPSEFIPLAEEAGLIDGLSWIVLEEVCRLLGSGAAPGLESVSINLSMQQFMDPGLTRRVSGALRRHGVSPGRLKVEVTERVLLDDMDRMRAGMCGLSSLGVQFHLDDFGTGYSNLSCVLDLPFECVKLDHSLLSAFPEDGRSELLVRTLLDLFHGLGLQVVAEGVESADQAEAVSFLGADWIQGYFYALPMPEEELLSFLHAHQECECLSTAAV